MIILVSMLIYLKPYKKPYINILESIVGINILILLMIASISTVSSFGMLFLFYTLNIAIVR